VGGRGGKVIEVTNLNDSGAGSFRAAVEASGPRIVVFRVGGTITTTSHINVKDPYLTIAGQTAPGEGVQVRGGMFKISTHDVIVRHMRFRPGDLMASSATGIDAVFLNGAKGSEAYNVVLDHCSMTWGPDTGGVSMSVDVHDVTVQDSITGEGLYLSHHKEGTANNGGHSKGMVISDLQGKYGPQHPTRITLLRNLFINSDDRNPSLQQVEAVDMVNCVIYNWGKHAAFGNAYSLNLIKNYFIRGPKTSDLTAYSPTDKSGETLHSNAVYEYGNLTEGFSTVRGKPSEVYSSTRKSPYSLNSELTPQQAYDRISASVGAIVPVRDSEDYRIISDLQSRGGTFLNGVGSPAPKISWPALASGTPRKDSDHDGMPDDWENSNGLTPNANDSAGDRDHDGYTNIEEYINSLK
jgi:pectate lyase